MTKLRAGDLVKCRVTSWTPEYVGILLKETVKPWSRRAREEVGWCGLGHGWMVILPSGPPRFFYEAHITLIQEGTLEDSEGIQEQVMMATKK